MPSFRPSRRLLRSALFGAGIAVVVWLAASLGIAYQLTRRPLRPFAEPVPAVSWGEIEAHRIRTRDGQELGAWLVKGKEDAPSILLLHGNGGSRGKCLTRAEVLAKQGYAVLLVSLRAHGDSTGEFNDIGYGARHDVVAGVEFLERRRPGRPVIIHGTSMGAAAAIFAAGTLGNRVRAYVLESPYRDLKTAVSNRTRAALPPGLSWIAYRSMLVASLLVLPELEQIAPVVKIGAIPADVPVLIMAGGEDDKARPEEARALFERVGSHGRLLIFERGGHVNFLDTEPERYTRAVLGFLRAAEGRGQGRPVLGAARGAPHPGPLPGGEGVRKAPSPPGRGPG